MHLLILRNAAAFSQKYAPPHAQEISPTKQGCSLLLSPSCNSGPLNEYLCTMQNEITTKDRFPDVKEENIKAMARRREEYSLLRDQRAKEDNEAIARRLEKEKENLGDN